MMAQNRTKSIYGTKGVLACKDLKHRIGLVNFGLVWKEKLGDQARLIALKHMVEKLQHDYMTSRLLCLNSGESKIVQLFAKTNSMKVIKDNV